MNSWNAKFSDTFETRKRSFIITFEVPLTDGKIRLDIFSKVYLILLHILVGFYNYVNNFNFQTDLSLLAGFTNIHLVICKPGL